MDLKDLIYRGTFGGTAVVLSYVLSHVIPWKVFGGIFAAFPAVMICAVMLTGARSGSRKAAETAQGAVFGMIGCMACVAVVLVVIEVFRVWWLGVGLGLAAWYLTAVTVFRLVEHRRSVRAPAQGGSSELPL